MGKSKKYRVINLDGIIISSFDTFVHVDWSDGIQSWENISTVNSRDELASFVRELDSQIAVLSAKKEKADKYQAKKELIGHLNALKKPLDQKCTKEDPEEQSIFEKEKNIFSKELMVGNENFLERDQSHTAKLNNHYKRMKFPEEKRFIEEQKNDSSTDSINILRQNYIFQKIPTIASQDTSQTHQLKKKTISKLFDRYYNNMDQKELIKSDLNKTVESNASKIFFRSIHVSMVIDIENLIDGTMLENVHFDFDFSITNIDLNLILQTSFICPEVYRVNIFRCTICNPITAFYNEMHSAKIKKASLVDKTSSRRFLRVLAVSNSFLETMFGTHNFLLIEIPKNMIKYKFLNFNPSGDISNSFFESKNPYVDSLDWKQNILLFMDCLVLGIQGHSVFFNNFAINFFHFALRRFSLNGTCNFFIFSDSRSFLTKEIRRFMITSGHQSTPLSPKLTDVIFIGSSYLNYIHSIPFLDHFKHSKTKFLLVDEKYILSQKYITEVFPSGGVITIHGNLINVFEETANISSVLDAINDSKKIWIFKIQNHIFNEFRLSIEKKVGTLSYKPLLEICEFFERCIDVDAPRYSDIEYIQFLEYKYFRTKRFFFTMNNSTDGKYVKTPDQLLEMIENR